MSVCFADLKNKNKIIPNQDLIVMIMNILRNDSYIRVEYKVFNSLTCEELQLGNCSIKNITWRWIMGDKSKVLAVCVSEKKGVVKHAVDFVEVNDKGIVGNITTLLTSTLIALL